MRPFNDTAAKPVPAWAPWPSPVSAAMLTGGTVGLSELQVDGDAVLWLEQRAAEGGRRALVRWTPAGGASEVLGPASDVGTRVHEYGGGGYIATGGIVVFSERGDGAVWVIDGAAAPRPLVAVPDCRYAAFALDLPRRRVYAVREDHRDRPPTAPINAIVALALDGATPDAPGEIVFGGSDFVLGPRLSPDGSQLAAIAWNHPQMPWDGTELYAIPLDAHGGAGAPLRIAGGIDEAIVAVDWAPDGELVFASDRNGWWNLYGWRDGALRALAADAAEFGEPPWVFGRRSFVALGDGSAVCKTIRDGVVRAALVEAGSVRDMGIGSVEGAPLPYGDGVAVITTAAAAPATVVLLARDGSARQLGTACATPLDPGDVSIGEPHVVATDDGEHTHVTFYAPRNAHAGDAALPPLIVMSHGGPTAMHESAYDVGIAAWTTRGFAVAHVNYRGSSGFGRAYRRRLNGAWGVVDVLDCIAAARYFGTNGACDPGRIVIRGGSASGMTALLAVATSHLFAAAVTRYGVMDLMALAAETHKFEARYTDGLIGPLPAAADLYRERSPLAHVDTIDTPVLIMQGLDDRVVPPDQATSMRDALIARGVRVDYEAFPGEGHGFRNAATIERAFERELAFYTDVFNS